MQQSRWLNQLRLRPQALEIHFELGMRAYEMGDAYVLARHRGAVGMLPEAGVDSPPFLALRWRELWLDGARVEAIQVAFQAYEDDPANVDTALDLSGLLDDLEKHPESLKVLLECAQLNQADADIWYQVGVAADQLDDLTLRRQAFRRVWEIEHEEGPLDRQWVAEDLLVRCVEGAIAHLPPMVTTMLGPVLHVFEDYPEEWILGSELGDSRVTVALEPTEDAGIEDARETRLIFFRWNIERLDVSEDELRGQLESAVRDEIAYVLGIDDDVLHFEGEG